MLCALPEELVLAHVAPHLSDRDLVNCAGLGCAALGAELGQRRRRFWQAHDDLRRLSARLAKVLRAVPFEACAEQLEGLSRHGYFVKRVPRPYTLFALFVVETAHFCAEACVFVDRVDAHITVTHLETGRRGYLQSSRRHMCTCVSAGGGDALQRTFQLAMEMGVGLRRTKRFLPVHDVTR